ncbi:hypothetical protein TWF730_006102 [Orbilia blumenaviensis]|uniref:Uncharacterized protein n=1 Tax=Orbilia blumenaviensis TaxID=1796055 RepID=A0AAV9TXY1_9PEZI
MPCAAPYLPDTIKLTPPNTKFSLRGTLNFYHRHGWSSNGFYAVVTHPNRDRYRGDWLLAYAELPFECQEQRFGRKVEWLLWEKWEKEREARRVKEREKEEAERRTSRVVEESEE